MEYHQSSQIPTLSYIENEDHPVFGTLVEQILHLLNSRLVFSDIIIHQNSPLMLRQPKGLVAVTDSPITKEELEEFFDVIEPNWAERIAVRAFDRSIDLHTARIRANCFSFQGKKRLGCVIRRFPKEPIALSELGLWQDEQEFARLSSGLVLIIGDTCQGKSTTIASMIDEINKQRSGHIITIEDPVEFVHPHRNCVITQREVGVDTDSFEAALKNSLRQAPDVIQIGEIRDRETMEHAIAFAETGHLCLATLHANSANQALDRIINFFPEERRQQLLMDLSLNMKGLISQRLIPKKEAKGRVVAMEILLNSPLISDLIFKGDVHEIKEIMKKSRELGMQTFDQALFDLYEADKISYEDALRNADSVNDLRLNIKLNSKNAKNRDFSAGMEHLGIV